MSDDFVDLLSSSVSEYERTSSITHSGILFRGETLEYWLEVSRLPAIDDGCSIDQLERFNHAFMSVTELVMSNFGYAKSCYDSSRMHYKSQLKSQINMIVCEFRETAGKRIPAASVVADMAEARCSDSHGAYKLAELYLEFWKIQFDKLKILDNRITGMNILKNVESRIR